MLFGVLQFPGSCDEVDALLAARRVADAELIWHRDRDLKGADAIVVPGGFSYGDYLRAGAIARFSPAMESVIAFAEEGGLVLGICNGFQVLVRAGLLPGGSPGRRATLARNDSGRFESRWVKLATRPGLSPFVASPLAATIELPVAHGEGRFVTAEPDHLDELESAGQIVLKYADGEGRATGSYPENPNGSPGAVAGLCDPTGRIFGLMPHPERFVDRWHHPRWTRHPESEGESGDGLAIFTNAVRWLEG